MRDNANQIDQTFLSLKMATRRGFLHRDYVAHCLRWTHVMRFLKPYGASRILELGCGVEAPLAKTIYTMRFARGKRYLGVDYGPIEPDIQFNGDFRPEFVASQDISTLQRKVIKDCLDGLPDLVVSFEVAEHMEPDRWVTAILAAIQNADWRASFLLSTPVFDPDVGPADNHINEWTYDAFRLIMGACGLRLVKNWGTFASQRDYKKMIVEKYGEGGQDMFTAFSSYFDANMLACVMAPLFPQQSRNVLWEFQSDDEIGVESRRRLTEFLEGTTHIHELGQCENREAWRRALELLDVSAPAWLASD